MWTPPPHRIEMNERDRSIAQVLRERFGEEVEQASQTSDMPSFQVAEPRLKDVLRFLKTEASPRFSRLDDLTAIDESARRDRKAFADYTLVYHLLSYESSSRVRLKVALHGEDPVTRSVTDLWPSANWY
jgi:NADH-quinone oxidoreductase subunit B/C/D